MPGCGCYYAGVDARLPEHDDLPPPRGDGLEEHPPTPYVLERYEILDTSGSPITGPARQRRRWHTAWATYAILGICLTVFLVFNILHPEQLVLLTFSPGNGLLFPGFITHMFAHADYMHLLINMFVLYFLGSWIDRFYGSTRYLALFFAAGIFAALAQAFVSPSGYLLGASGALAGVMAAFVRHFPRERLWIWGILPVPAWLAVLLWLVYNIIGAGNAGEAGIAFTAHLGGFAAGWVVSFMLVPPGRIRGRQ